MYIVLIPDYWGCGDTVLTAANNARKAGGNRKSKSLPVPRIVYSYDPKETPEAFVDECGQLCWRGKRPAIVERIKEAQ